MQIKENSNKELVNIIRKKLKENKDKYGKIFCPCVLPSNRNDDTVCVKNLET